MDYTCGLEGWEHSRFFKAVANCVRATGLPMVDMSGSDVARACFLPYDPQAYINPKYNEYVKENIFAQDWENVPFENRVPELPKLLPAPNLASENKEEEVERIICEIEQRAVDIAPEYKDWVELGFALIDGFG